MKTKLIYRSICLLCILLACCQTGFGRNLDVRETKEINKSFQWESTDEVEISNKYGEITITHWDRPEVAFRIVIEARARKKEIAQKTLERISIRFSDAGNRLSAQTQIDDENQSGLKWWNGNIEFKILYYVSLPSQAVCTMEQKYGNILMLERHEGDCRISAKYGNIELGDLGGRLHIESKYGNVKFGDFTKAELTLGYSGNVIAGSGEQLKVDSKYSNTKITSANTLDMEMKYGNLEAETIGNLSLDSKYSNATIQRLQNSLSTPDFDYGKLRIKEVDANFQLIDIDANYSTVELNIPARSSFAINAEGFRYGSFKIRGFDHQNVIHESENDFHGEINGGKQGKLRFDGNDYSNLLIKSAN